MSNRIAPPKTDSPLGFDSIIRLQKHKGKSVRDVIEEDPGWLVWCHNDLDFVPWFKLTDEALKEATDCARILEERRSADAQAYAEGYGPGDDPRDYDPFEGVFGTDGPDEGDGYDEYK